ncbi:hypothetical protein [Halalkalibacter nanhaiisediminis]|uniref:Uncharacterized protein n=1 Tax=Halalkalibacter nanhaiisediminis TaxID=688079 RepID=A0A562Q9B8_9BACI|nr:hypothetical protein [Halalkalibacter nanhaiisediminis]TWI53308.1 hypothetical protein IQ10_03443 [Halalkalibacter nanhaiisediminis]
MTKIQFSQVVAVISLIIFVVISYQQGYRNDFIFYPLVSINLILWILRMRERRSKGHSVEE